MTQPSPAPARRLSRLFPVRAVALLAALGAATALATAVTRLLVPPAPSPLHQWVAAKNLLLPLLLLWAYGRVVRALERREPSETAPRGALVPLLAGAGVGAAIVGAYVAVMLALGMARLGGGVATNGVVPIANVLLVPMLTAIAEELFFRAILFRQLEAMAGTGVGLAISSALFGLAHTANDGAGAAALVGLAVAGALLAAGYAATRAIWFPVGLHFAWNFTEGCLFGLPNSGQLEPVRVMQTTLSGPTALTGGAFGPEASFLFLALTSIATAALWTLAVRRGRWRGVRLSLREVPT